MERARTDINNYAIETPLDIRVPPRTFSAQRTDNGHRVALKIIPLPLAENSPSPERSNLRAYIRARIDSVLAITSLHVAVIEEAWLEREYCGIATELLDQETTLADLLAQVGPGEAALPLNVALNIAWQAATALEAIHRQTYHGNLKPSNLLLVDDATTLSGYYLKLVDFAFVPPDLATPDHDLLSYTWTPERLRGMGVNFGVDRNSDLYSMGAILYHCLTGTPAFDAETFDQATLQHVYGNRRSPISLRPELPSGLAAVLLRCLSVNPAERPEADRLVSAIEDAQKELQHITGQPHSSIAATMFAPRFYPQLQVFYRRDSNGNQQPLIRQPINGDGLRLGNGSGCDIVLPAERIADSQLQIDWDGEQIRFTSLANTGAIVLQGQPITDHRAHAWTWGQELCVGPYDLVLERPQKWLIPATSASDQTATPARVIADILPRAASARLQMTLSPTELTIKPGLVATAELTITNLGDIADNLDITVEETLPASWIRGLPVHVDMIPGDRKTHPLQIEVPITSESIAREYTVTVRATSLPIPGDYQRAEARWRIQPFYACTLDIRPRQRAALRNARYRLALCNTGNVATTFRLSGEDDEQILDFNFGSLRIEVLPGQTQSLPLSVRSTRWWGWHVFGAVVQRTFQVQTMAREDQAVQRGSARFDQHPLIPIWLQRSLLLLLLLLALAIYLTRADSRMDRNLMGQPFYGVLRPTPTETATALPTVTIALVIPLDTLSFALPTSMPTHTPLPTPTDIPLPTPTNAPPPTDTPLPTSTSTPTPAPISDGEVVFCPRETPIIINGTGVPSTTYGLMFDDVFVSLGEYGHPLIPLQIGADGTYRIPLMVGPYEANGIHRVRVVPISTKHAEAGGTPVVQEIQIVGPSLRDFSCELLPPGVLPTATPTPTASPLATPSPSSSG